MATRRKAASPATTEGAEGAVPMQLPATIDADYIDDPDSEDSVLDRIRSLGGEDRDRMRIKVYRKTTAGQLEWCTDYTVGEWEEGDVSRVRADWGAGTYEMRVTSSGRRGILYREVFRIAADARPNPAPAAAPTSELADVVRMLAEGQQRILEAVSQRPDPTAQLQSTLGLMASMREAMGLNVAPAAAPAQSSDPGAMLGQIVGAIRQLREVAQEVAPQPADPESPMQMFGQIVDVAKLALSKGSAPAPAMNPLAIPFSINNPEPQENPEMLGMLVLRGKLDSLVKMAASGKTPQEGAQYIVENLPDDMLQYLDLPNVVDVLASVNGKVREHAAWMLTARDEALRLLNEDDGGPVLPPKDANG